MVRWIVFDAMGVIFEEGDDILNRLIPFLHRRGFALDAETVHAIYRRASLGQISPREFWTGLGLDGEYPAIEDEYLDTCLSLDPDFLKTAELLAENFSLAMLSNDIAEWSAHLRRRHGLDRLIQTAVISSEAGIRKPDAGVYRILLDRLHSEGKDCLFIDDRVENLSSAAALGMIPVRLGGADDPNAREIPYRINNLLDLPALVEEIFPSA